MNRSRRTRAWRRAAPHPPSRALSESSDERLVELVVEGDGTAFELLYMRHVAEALAFASGLLGSGEDAEEAVRHSFAAAHAYLAEVGRETAFEPWLYVILENHCLSMLAQRAPGAGESEEEGTAVVDLDQWRRRRRPLGVGLPVAPGAGFHDSVMTACGLGGGAATATATATPLLGGALAKVAVVVVLAGGGGAAGGAVSDRGVAAEGHVAEAMSVRAGEGVRSRAADSAARAVRPARRMDGSSRELAAGTGDMVQRAPARPESRLVTPARGPNERSPSSPGGPPRTEPSTGVQLPLPDGAPAPVRGPTQQVDLPPGVPTVPSLEEPAVPRPVKAPDLPAPVLDEPAVELPSVAGPPKVRDDGRVKPVRPVRPVTPQADRAFSRRPTPAT